MNTSNKLAIIAIIVAIVLGSPALVFTVILPYWHDHYAVEDTGKIYKNYPLDFQIKRPDLSWSFDTNWVDYAHKIGTRTINPDILGGVVVESPDRSVAENPPSPDRVVIVLVLKGNTLGTTDLNNFAQVQKQEFIANFPNASFDIHPSMNGDVFVTAKDVPSTPRIYFQEKIESHGGNVYLVALELDSEQPVSPETSQKLNDTFNSFDSVSNKS